MRRREYENHNKIFEKVFNTSDRVCRKHKDGLVMVPVYFVDRPATDSRDGEQMRIAVNGRAARRGSWRVFRK